MNNKLTILIPCYNEERWIISVLKKVSEVQIEHIYSREIIIVNDASTDGTLSRINDFCTGNPQVDARVISHEKNSGKGAAVKSGLEKATGNIVIIQDADLEYDPSEYSRMIKPIVNGHADVVFGSRFRGSEPHRILFYFHTVGNKLLTFLSNLFTQLNLTDMETGYKMFRTDILKQITLKEKRFGFEPEVTAKVSRVKDVRIYEVGISYYGRTFTDGKKIRWTDGFVAIYCILKYNIFSKK